MQCVEKVSTPTPDPTTRIPNSSVLLSVTKNPNGGISETKRAIRDPLVSKRIVVARRAQRKHEGPNRKPKWPQA